jgi:ATP-dependent helicase/nuclease subunit A
LQHTETVEKLKLEADRLQRQRAISPEEIALLDWDALADFWSSELGKRIREHRQYVHRELPFTARFSPRDLTNLTHERLEPILQSEFVIVQGVADLVAILPKEIWLLDFKTDDIKRHEVAARTALYEPQLKLYALALARIYARPVTDCRLYFLRPRMDVAIRLTQRDSAGD